jgi:Flp pilus assembly protein TadB
MFDDPDGQKIMVAAVVAQVIGRFTINRIVDIKV